MNEVDYMIDDLIERAKKASYEFSLLSQEQVDRIVKSMAMAALQNHMYLARLAINETKRGVYEDKIIKNMFASEYIYHSIKHDKTVGIIEDNAEDDSMLIADPVGIIAGITPVTNPTSTVMFKSLISAKTRNVIIFGFHPSAQMCSSETAKILKAAGIKEGAPEDFILWIDKPSIEATTALMRHKDVNLILATGGTNMVKAAYSCGKAALGVGPGNVPCYIEKTATLRRSINDLVISKSFDNGMICASEQAVLVDDEIKDQFESIMKEYGAYFVNEEEKRLLTAYMFLENNDLNNNVVGQTPYNIAKRSGFEIPINTKVLVVKENGVGPDHPFSKEKLSPVLAYYNVENCDRAIRLAERLIEYGGLGHSAVIHSNNNEIINKYSTVVKVGRIIVNSPAAHGAIGDLYNTNIPSLTLGCGTFGGNSTTSNISSINLINIKRVAKRKVNLQWFRVPEKIFFERGSIGYLSQMEGIERAFIVTDESMIKLGFVDKILYHLKKRSNSVYTIVFAQVETDPSFDTIMKGVERMKLFNPDTIVALGGGSAIDTAKGMWLFYENPDANLDGLKLKYLDIRKRTYKYPDVGNKVKLIAIPTTSGTGSEVTSFAVITDKNNNIKYPLSDYELTPDVSIIDPDLVMGLPKIQTADTGMDVLTHAIEAYVSSWASDFTDGLCEKATEIVFTYLKEAYSNPDNYIAREKMHNASTIAGMAFTNAFLGINHSLAHKIGAEFHLSHGRTNAILLPYVIKYNSQMPSKFISFPKYEYYIADKRYAQLVRKLGFNYNTTQEGVNILINEVIKLNDYLNIPRSFKECGLDENDYMSKLDILADNAFEDQCTISNPRQPFVSELKQIMIDAYYGNL